MTIRIDDSPVAPVLALPVKPRTTSTERVLTMAPSYKCMHRRFSIDERLAQVTCSDCKERLDPMVALVSLSHQESRYHELHERYQDEMKRLKERSRTKCRHCGEMTPISYR